MSKTATAPLWKDEFGSEMQPCLQCDIEINVETGASPEAVNAATAWALRELAAQIEADTLDSGFHAVKGPNGETIGQVYLDHTGKA